MSGSSGAALVWEDRLARYDLGAAHPLKPVRVELTVALIRALGITSGATVEVRPAAFDEDELLRIHDQQYVEVVRAVGAGSDGRGARLYGLGTADNPVFPRMHEASVDVCAASRTAAELVLTGGASHAFSPAGGLHHAMPARAAGFCVYNDPALAIDWLLRNGAERVAYVDVDVHHGDGVQEMFYDDPRVLTISLHESGRYLFPSTGFPDEIGRDGAEGTAVNVPLAPLTTGAVWLDAFDAVVEPLVEAFAPDVLCTQLGCDTHVTDPLAHLALTVDDMRAAVGRLHDLAHRLTEGRWVAFGGGGYQLVKVVPRAWAAAFAEMAGADLPEATPEDWREVARERAGESGPTSFHDDPVLLTDEHRADVVGAAREAVEAVRELVFPHHGL